MTAGEGGESSFGFADVKPLTDVLLTEVRAELGDRLTAVALYGSVARGEAHRWSDIDLFVVHRGDRETVSEAFLTAELRLRDQPLARELTARGVPTAPVVSPICALARSSPCNDACMSNHERGRKLMAAALEYLGEMDAAIARASWNITVRHAQDVVELVMKAVLGYLCIDYPKVHDTADVFIAGLARRQMGLNDDEAADVRAVSSWLAGKRAPAFSFEYDEEADVARAAAEDARRIHRLCARLVAAIEERQRQSESGASDVE